MRFGRRCVNHHHHRETHQGTLCALLQGKLQVLGRIHGHPPVIALAGRVLDDNLVLLDVEGVGFGLGKGQSNDLFAKSFQVFIYLTTLTYLYRDTSR